MLKINKIFLWLGLAIVFGGYILLTNCSKLKSIYKLNRGIVIEKTQYNDPYNDEMVYMICVSNEKKKMIEFWVIGSNQFYQVKKGNEVGIRR